MPLAIVCGGCKRKLRIPETLVGKPVKCPGCARKLSTTPKPKATDNVAAKPAAKASAQTAAKGSTKVAADPKKAALKKPAPVPAAKSNVKPVAPAKPKAEAPVKPAAKPTPAPKPVPAPPPPASKPKPAPTHRKSSDDDEGSGASKFVIIGGGFVGLFLAGLAIWWLFFTGSEFGALGGTITQDGVPLAGANITFHAEDAKMNPFPAQTKPDGKYTVPGSTGLGIPPGSYKITINKLVMPDGSPIPPSVTPDDPRLKELVPPEYSEFEKSTLRFVVKIGANKFDKDVPKR